MFSTEIRINGNMVIHIYGRNLGQRGNKHKYEYEHYEVASRTLISGEIYHLREDGIQKLIALILEDVYKKRNSKDD